MIRAYARKGIRVIGVCVADTSYSHGANNTLNTLKTLSAIAKNNSIYLPLVVLSNDVATTRSAVDTMATQVVSDIIDILTSPVYEVDRNDRLNWIDPMDVIKADPGLKLLTFISDIDASGIVLGKKSKEMADSLLILQNNPDDDTGLGTTLSRLKKTGFYNNLGKILIGKVSSDISDIESIIDNVENMTQLTQDQKHQKIDRLNSSGGSDLIL